MAEERAQELGDAREEQSPASVPSVPGPAPALARVLALQRSAGNAAVSQLMREPAAAPPAADGAAPTGKTNRSSVERAASDIFENLRLAQTESRRESTLRELLVHADQAGELMKAYREQYKKELLDDIGSVMGREDTLRADEYLTWGRLRPVAKVLLAIDGAGTKEETVWRVLPEAHAEGDPAGKWSQLVQRPIAICKRWSSFTLEGALDDDFDGADYYKAIALARYGKLRPEDKVKVATADAGTEEDVLFEGLREGGGGAAIRAAYKAAYGGDLDTLLFDQYDDEGTKTNTGELSGEDAAYARVLLDVAVSDVNRLVKVVKVAVDGAGTNEQMIWDAVNEAIKRRDAGKGADAEAAKAQLDALSAKVADPDDPLGLKGFWGDLDDDEHARLRAMLGLQETSGGSRVDAATLNDPLVRRLRAMGGISWDSVFDAALELDGESLPPFAAAFKDDSSPLRKYLNANTTVSSGKRGELFTVFGGTLYERLRLCAGGFRDDYEDYAYNLLRSHATPDQRRALRTALRKADKDEAPEGDAGSAVVALKGAFSTGEMGKVRTILQTDSIDVLDRATELEADVKREESWWYGTDEATKDEQRQMRADITQAGLDARMTPAEEARIRASQGQVAAALADYVRVRDQFTDYASQAISFAAGILIAAATGGAAGPAVIAAIMRAAAASALARVAAEKALRGDRFDLVGGDGVRAFINGAVDGAMNVAGGAVAARAMGRIGGPAMREALELGTASVGVKMVSGTIDGSVGGGVGGAVDAVTNEDTWRGGVFKGLENVFNQGIASAGQGAAMSAGVTAATHGAGKVFGPKGATGPHGAGATPDAPGGTGTAAGAPKPGDLFDAHPLVSMAQGGDDLACAELLHQFGRWEHAIAHIQNGTGKAAGLSETARPALTKALVEHRERLLGQLENQFGAKRVGQASAESGSDVDLNVMGETAGQKLLDARRWLDANHPGWRERYRMGLLIDASRVGTVGEHLAALPPHLKAEVEARITRTTELYSLARRARAAQGEERLALLAKVSGEERARLESLVSMDKAAMQAAHDRALMDGDALMARLRGETNELEKARIAAQISETQMLANMLDDDAYISPGAVGQFANKTPARTPAERYQAVVDQIDMLAHQVHEGGGVLGAMRRYEIFKYIQRFCDVAEASGAVEGDDLARLRFFRNWAEYVYKVERDATASAADTPGPRNLTSKAGQGDVRLTDTHEARPGVSDKFLLDNYADFASFADRVAGKMRQGAMGDAAGKEGPLVSMPKMNAADEAARSATTGTGAATVGGVNVAAGVAAEGKTPLIGGKAAVNRPIGNPVADEAAARAVMTRLTAGDVTALDAIGVKPPTPDYDPRGREWGVGRTKDGQIVILQGMVGGVKWDAFIADGGTPISHSHPLLEGRLMTSPGKTMQELLPGTGQKNADAIHVLPSVEDFMFCGEKKLGYHEVHVPYANVGGGKIGNPAPGLPLIHFKIIGIEQVGLSGQIPVYRALLAVGDSNGGTFDVAPVWVVGNQHLNSILTAPPDGMTPMPTAATVPDAVSGPTGNPGTGGASGAGQERK